MSAWLVCECWQPVATASLPRAAAMIGPLRPAFLLSSLLALAAGQGGCPEPYGLQTYPHEGYCDKFYKCANGQ